MSTSSPRRAWFSLQATRSRALAEQGCFPWVVEAVTLLRFVTGEGSQSPSEPLPFYLDTGAFVSVIPEVWTTTRKLARFLGGLSESVSFSTVAGAGGGRMARVSMQFVMDSEGVYDMDVLVSPNLNDRDYGLVALRDIIPHFEITTKGRWRIDPDGVLVERPDLILTPRL